MSLPEALKISLLSAEALQSLDSMEGVYSDPVVETAPRKLVISKPAGVLPAYAVAASIAAASYALHYFPAPPFRIGGASGVRYPVSAAIIAILAGAAVRNMLPLSASMIESMKGLPRRVIPPTIVLTGAGLNLAAIASIGFRTVAITVACIVIATGAAIFLGAALGLWRKTAILIGAGTGICGTSAIVAVAPLIEAEDRDLMLAIGTVNILGLLAMFLLPVAGAFLKLNDQAFGVWAGTSIHAVPQAVAAGFAYSQPAGALATLVKLVRVALLAPFMFALGLWYARRTKHGNARIHYHRLVPVFVWGFLLLAALNTADLLPVLLFRLGRVSMSGLLTNIGELLLTMAMAAMGLEVNVHLFAKTGGRALLAGALASVILCAASLLLIRILL